MTSHEAALWRQESTEGDDWRPTFGGGSAHVVPATVDDVQSAAAVRVGKRHLARSVSAGVRDVIAGSDVTAIAVDVSVNGREMDAFLGIAGRV